MLRSEHREKTYQDVWMAKTIALATALNNIQLFNLFIKKFHIERSHSH
ncbi:hypothetical protein THF1C08_180031 [Vibrio jasicida]|uniref:Transposase n=1 Tax=Vibrio jasicida TaxID=766224 RepID=A0AAU9QL68_9VIBR|nr:hypothetical protein THF1C08_180031 [Vibrio jasicida]CAH1581274.1 hypothetical protein THF1A12_170032 [Vibrio jasicida]